MKIERVETFCSLFVSINDVITMLKAMDHLGSISINDPDISRLKNELKDAYKRMTGKEYT